MTILVDDLRDYETPLRYKTWCHMVSTVGADELHAFAARLGLKRAWSQERPRASAHHYDLVPSKRALALRLGAVAVPARELACRNYDGLRRRGLLPQLPEFSGMDDG
jgi:hypothetical protein